MLVAQRINNQGNGDVKFFLTDHLGSTSTTIRANGTLEAQLRYDPWGEERYTVGTTPTGYRYTGQRQDDTLGLYDYNARYYDPTIGRFISADTIIPGMSGGAIGPNSEERLTPLTVGFHETMLLETANEENRQFLSFGPSILWNIEQRDEFHVPMGPLNPQTLNRYAYTLNNGLKNIDPTGHIGVAFSIKLTKAQAMWLAGLLGGVGGGAPQENLADASEFIAIALTAVASLSAIAMLYVPLAPFFALLAAVLYVGAAMFASAAQVFGDIAAALAYAASLGDGPVTLTVIAEDGILTYIVEGNGYKWVSPWYEQLISQVAAGLLITWMIGVQTFSDVKIDLSILMLRQTFFVDVQGVSTYV